MTRCSQPDATAWLAFGVGSLLGAAWVLGRWLVVPWRVSRRL